MEIHDIESAIEGILFAAGDPVPVERIAAVLGTDAGLVSDVADTMRDKYSFNRRGIRLVRLENSLQLCSSPEYADYIRLALETGKQPRLSQPAVETLSVIAYFQPVTKAYIEQVRGVDSSYTVGLLQSRGLIEARGRLAVAGRPVLYGTTADFLRTFGLSSLDELPMLQSIETDEDGQLRLSMFPESEGGV
ncbi:MAG: SMC-Scp complex subunit ScpB [Oscillospiraceae bacterium]|jgi:segregation and condensation protein B|nr:SMC-Scp complex subunit ScpB [Oscillospiraceae bacterium]